MDWSELRDPAFWLSPEMVMAWARAALYLLVGGVIGRVLGAAVERALARALPPERTALARRLVTWGIVGLALASALREVGFDLSVLLGMAGVVTVAVGFASQTSASNLISGLFLVLERPFSVGDVVQIGTTSGEVLAIDLLSARLRTFDNRYVRIPNETVMKSEIVNLTRFPIRRIDLPLALSYDDREGDLETVRALLCGVLETNPLVLDEPGPDLHFVRFGELGIEVKLVCWSTRENFFRVEREAAWAARKALVEAGRIQPALGVARRPPE